MEILNLFGIDWRLMVAQLVNFAIVVAVLWWFALKPLAKKMKERNREIEKGLDDAKKAEVRLTEVEKVVKDKIKESKFDAEVILIQAKKQSEENRRQETEKTKKEVVELIERAKKQLENEKQVMVKEAKGELGEMIVAALEKILSEKLSNELDKEYVRQVIKTLKH